MANDDYIKFIPKGRTMQWISRAHVAIYRLTRGRIGAYLDKLDMLLLTTVGRKSGLERTTPMPYFPDGEVYVSIASNGGRPTHSAWVHNVRAQPEVTLQVRERVFRARADFAAGEERARLWAKITQEHPRYADYQAATEREIPVVIFTPLEGRGA